MKQSLPPNIRRGTVVNSELNLISPRTGDLKHPDEVDGALRNVACLLKEVETMFVTCAQGANRACQMAVIAIMMLSGQFDKENARGILSKVRDLRAIADCSTTGPNDKGNHLTGQEFVHHTGRAHSQGRRKASD